MKTLEERRKEFEKKFVGTGSCKDYISNTQAIMLWQWFKLQLEEEHREQVLHKSYNKKNTLRLAKFMHEEYENMARLQDWETQEKCRVSFEALPEKNIKTMLGVAQQILKNFLPTLKNSKGGKR